jgi:hypothetical protein
MGHGRPANSEQTFWSKVDRRGPDECWPWKLCSKNGYGRFAIDRREEYAHRFAYFLENGSMPSGRLSPIMHTCNNKLCCNPSHLKIGTISDNTNSAYRDGLIPRGENHARAKYSNELIAKIKADARPQLVLESEYGVSQTHISCIKRGIIRQKDI